VGLNVLWEGGGDDGEDDGDLERQTHPLLRREDGAIEGMNGREGRGGEDGGMDGRRALHPQCGS